MYDMALLLPCPLLHLPQGGNLVPVTEHKWLGNDAYRLGETLGKEGLPKLACQVLNLSCEETLAWCRYDKKPPQRSLEVSYNNDSS